MQRKRNVITALLLALSLLASSLCLASCGETGETGETRPEAGTAAETETAAPSAYEKVTKDDWNGRAFTILCRSESKNTYLRDFLVEELGAKGNTLLDDSIYERNRVVSNDLHITIEPIAYGTYSDVNQAILTQSSSGTDDYDAIVGHLYTYTGCAVNKTLWNLAELETLDMSAAWWDTECVTNLSAYGYTPLLCGDIVPGSMTQSACLAFNKKLMKDMKKDEPYDAVRAGTWTLDMLNEVTADVTSDLNGDGKIVPEDDMFGIAANAIDTFFSMYYGCGTRFIEVDADGVPEVSFDHDKAIDVYDTMYQGLITQQAFCLTNQTIKHTDVFIAGRALYLDNKLLGMSRLSAEMSDDYGIVPEPKYDEGQEDYCAFINGDTPLVGIISSETTPEFSGAVLEAMGAYNYTNITPLLFEIVTKSRNARDPESAEMVDVIISHRVFDFAYFYDTDLGWLVYDNLKAGKPSISSAMKTAERSTVNQLKKIVKEMAK